MTQEEKFEEAKRLYETANADQRYVLESLFPELAESEDDRIRKAILELVRQSSEILEKKNQEQMIAWLEKQGKNNMGISEATKKKLEDNLNKALEKETPESFNKFLDEQGEQKPAESNDIEDVLLVHDETLNNLLERYKTSATFKTLIVNLQNWWNNTRRHLLSFNIEQNSAWSEKDEEMLKLVIKSCEQCGNEYAYYWLESLKERVQPKQEWSEEDEEMVQVAINACNSYQDSLVRNDSRFDKAVKAEEWLKSLKDRYTWKPSDEQMDALESAVVDSISSIQKHSLESLYNELKKLF